MLQADLFCGVLLEKYKMSKAVAEMKLKWMKNEIRR